jgi:hypothetical protein
MRAFLILLLLAFVGSAHAHIPLSPAILDDAYEELQQAQTAAKMAANKTEQAAAIYDITLAASALTDLLNQEVQFHGFDQQSLLDEAVFKAVDLGVEIMWSENHERYFYAGYAFRQYLEVMPEGINAANSHYRLIENDFYLGDAENRESMVARANIENEFLQRYPDFGNAGRVAMFLSIDYRDIWRNCKAANEPDCANQYAKLNRDHLAAISVRYEGTRTAELAQTMLQRFETEFANSE